MTRRLVARVLAAGVAGVLSLGTPVPVAAMLRTEEADGIGRAAKTVTVRGTVRIERPCITGDSADPQCAALRRGGLVVTATRRSDGARAVRRARTGAQGGYALDLGRGNWTLKAKGPGRCPAFALTVSPPADPGAIDLVCSLTPPMSSAQLPY